jgi:hypothetical protein
MSDNPPPLFVLRGDASAEEIAALTAVLQSLAAGATSGAETRQPTSEWAAPHRMVRSPYPSGPCGWRSSALPG